MNKYVKSAPPILIDWYENQKIGKGRNFLGQLIMHPDMALAWRELSKRNKNKDHATKLFGMIVFIEQESRKPVRLFRSEEKKQFLKIAEHTRQLVAAIIAEGSLDKRVFDYFSAETMHINGIANWEEKNQMERNNLPYNLLEEWPTLIDILKSLETQAIKLGGDAMTQTRTVNRQKAGYRELYFVRALTEYVKSEYGSPLYGTVARISSAVLGIALTKEDVEKKVSGSA